ncbi:MAG: AAA family ATPase [Alphaproteobacteria bacterium]
MGQYYLIAFEQPPTEATERFNILFGGSVACNETSYLVYSAQDAFDDVSKIVGASYPPRKAPSMAISAGCGGWHFKDMWEKIRALKDIGNAHQRSANWQKDAQALTPVEKVSVLNTKALAKIEKELEKMHGLSDIANAFRTVSSRQKVESLKAAAGLKKGEQPGYHTLLLSNIGMGAEDVASFYAQWLKAHGILSKGHMIETDRSKLVGKHIGETEEKTAKVLESAQGGVLYIRKAGSLFNESKNDFGAVALEQIVLCMSDARNDVTVIMNGTAKDMQQLYELNGELRSCFNLTLHVPDCSNDMLVKLAHDKMAAQELTPCAAFDDIFDAIINDLRGRDRQNFGNRRFVRTFVEKLGGEVSQRLEKEGKLDRRLAPGAKKTSGKAVKKLLTVTPEDLWRVAERECNLPRKKIGPPGLAVSVPTTPVTDNVIQGSFGKRSSPKPP